MAVPDWIMLLFAAVSIFSGIRAIRRRYADTDVSEFRGDSAVRMGWVWIVIGIVFLLAVLFDISFLKAAIRLFFEA